MYKPISAKEIKDALMMMVEVERTMGKLYQYCADCFPEDKQFWLGIVEQETQHTKSILKMGKIIAKKRDQFEMNRPFNSTAMKTVISGIKMNMERVKSGAIPKSRMLAIAYDLEQSILESKYAEIFKTADVEYQNLLRKILDDTGAHKKIIQVKMATQSQRAGSHPAGGFQTASGV